MQPKERTVISLPPDSSGHATADLPSDPLATAAIIVATVATVFALSAAQKFFVPLVFGVILACTLNPLVRFLERLKIPRLIGSTLVMALLLCGLAAATLSLRAQVDK